MTWMQTEIPFGDRAATVVQDRVADLHRAKSAAEKSVSFEFALYCRDIDYERTILLISPEVAAFVTSLPGDWVEGSPGDEEWTMLYGDVRSSRLLGVKGPTRLG